MSTMLFCIEVFGSSYGVDEDGFVRVYWDGHRKRYQRRADESAVNMQKRIEEDITDVERTKVRRTPVSASR